MKNYIKTPKKKIRNHKRHFQLLELMVAAFILLVCIAPAMQIFTSMYHAQQEIIRENQRDHLAHRIHAKITELLYKRQIHIPSGDKNPPISLPDPELIEELKRFSYSFEATLVIIDSTTPKNQENPNRYLAQLVVKLKDVSPKIQKKEKIFENKDPSETFYDYIIYIDAGCKDKDNKDEEDKNEKEENDQEEEGDEDQQQNKKNTAGKTGLNPQAGLNPPNTRKKSSAQTKNKNPSTNQLKEKE